MENDTMAHSYELTSRMISQTHLALKRITDAHLAVMNLTAVQVAVLRELTREEFLSISELAARVQRAYTEVVRVVVRLKKKYFLTREIDPRNRRKVRVRLTRKGRHEYDRAVKSVTPITEAFYSGFTEAELSELRNALRRICRNGEALKDKKAPTDIVSSSVA